MTMPQLQKACRATAFILAMAFGFSSTSAMAHAHLKQQTPTAEEIMTTSPAEISLKFSEGIELQFSKITLSTNNTPIETGALTLDKQDNTRLIAPIITPLAAGKYSVIWNVVSIDGHKTKGNYSFSVKP